MTNTTLRRRRFKDYFNRRMLTMLLLGFASGLPLALGGGALQTWFKTSGVDIVIIGSLTLIGQPYAYKFLWAPLLDRFVPPLLGRRRGWIMMMQIAIILVIISMSFMDPLTSSRWLFGLGFLLAIFSATQDIASDAYRADLLQPDERGLGAALFIEGYRAAMIVSGGLSYVLADQIGWQKTYLCMSSLMLVGILATLLAPSVEYVKSNRGNLWKTVVESVRDFLSHQNPVLIILFIILYKLGDAFSHALSSAFLLDMSFSLTEVGTIVKFVGLTATLLGIFVGGVLMTRIGIFRALLFFGLLQAITHLSYMLLSLVGKNYSLAVVAFFIESLCGGMGNAALVAFLMTLCNPNYSATQYALFSSLTAIGRIYVGPVSGLLVKHYGWTVFFGFTGIISIPGLLLLWILKKTIDAAEDKSLRQ